MRSFTEVVELTALSAETPAGPVLEKVYYNRANVLYRCDPDLTNHETIYTWVAEAAGGIQGIAIDHINQKVLLAGYTTDIILQLDYDGSNPTTLLTSSADIDAGCQLIIDELNQKVVWKALASTRQADLDGANQEQYIAENGHGITIDVANEKYLYSHAAATDTIRQAASGQTPPATDALITAATGASTMYGMAFDSARTRIWYGESGLRINYVSDPYGTPAVSLDWAPNLNATCRGVAYDHIGDQLFVCARSASVNYNGLWILTDLDEVASAHAALADYALAAKHQPQLVAVHLARGLMFFDAGRNAEAAAELDLFLAEEPASVTGRTARARVHVALGDSLGAADDYDFAIARSRPRPSPALHRDKDPSSRRFAPASYAP